MKIVELTPEENLLAAIFGQYPGPSEHLVDPSKIEDLKLMIKDLLDSLPSNNCRTAVNLAFGLENREGKREGHFTLKGIASAMSFKTQERPRQLLVKSLRILRHPSRSRQLKTYLPPLTDEEELDRGAFDRAIWECVEEIKGRWISVGYVGKRLKREARVIRFSQLKGLSEKEALSLIKAGRNTLTVRCLLALWRRANTSEEQN